MRHDFEVILSGPDLIENLRRRPVLVIITGAGASYDSIRSLPPLRDQQPADRPPLTQDLFSDRNLSEFLEPYPAARTLVAALTVDPSLTDFETLLNREYEASAGDANMLRRFVALRLYLRDMLTFRSQRWSSLVGGATNYSWLIGEIEHWRWRSNGYVAWVTFNYDPLLEDGLAAHYRYDFGIGGPEDAALVRYVSNPDWCLTHLHGSTRWTRLTSLPRGGFGQNDAADAIVDSWDSSSDAPSQDSVYQRALGLNPDLGYRNSVLLGRGQELIGVPAISSPLASKSSFECPPSHLDHLGSVLTQSDFILTIGWRAQEEHFLKLIAAALGNTPDIAAISQSKESAERVCSNLRAALDVRQPSQARITSSEADGFSSLRTLAGPQFRDQISGLVEASALRRGALWVHERGPRP